jgi:glycosyltransferase involved in cell wall biosynthesis
VEIAPWLLANGLPDGCFMDLGSVPYAQLGQILQQADVAVFPNRCIADPNRLAMASLACGCSTILSANTGHLDLLRHNLGYPLYAQRPIHGSSAFGTDGWGETDVEEVVETLEWIYTNRQEASYRSSAAIEFLREWTWETYVQHFLQAIATI